MQPYINKPCEIIKLDRYTGKIPLPSLLLMNPSFHIIGKISRYENWEIRIVANGLDEIIFYVHKYTDGMLCPIWDDLVDLKIVDVDGFGRFEISVDYTDNTETVKSVHGFSLETELAQIGLYEFHVNDEEAADMEVTDYSKDNYDSEGNFIPTVFYNPKDKKHSLLHRVLADKAPHWSIGYVSPWIALDEESQPEESSKFQRTYTVDSDSIYDFLTGTVSEESNVIFVFDTINREINCYSLCDCIDQETGEMLCKGIGEDTMVFVSKNKLANEISISSNKDKVKNCFRIEGGDDVITDMVRAVNMNGSNYIYQFADFQYNDMSEELKKKITEYQEIMASQEVKDAYYGETGIYTRLCKAYDDLAYYESSMMPNTDAVTDVGTAKEQYEKVISELKKSPVAVSSMNNYNDNLFAGVTNNIESYAKVFLDSRFDLEIIDGTESYSYVKGEETGTWKGKIRITQHTNEKNVYPVDVSAVPDIEITVNADELEFAKQKIHKALSSGSMADIDFKVSEMSAEEMWVYFSQYSLNRLNSFYDGYNSCLSILMELGKTATSDVNDTIYDIYYGRMKIVSDVLDIRQNQVDEINSRISQIQKEQQKFQEDHDFYKKLGDDLYKEFCAYRREDTYTNSNYISDGLSTSECLEKAKELVEVATKEAKKACMLQRTVSTSMNNLFALPEFEPLWDKFALFNYIRVKTDDEVLKLRLIGIDFRGDSVQEIQVTFSEQIESVEGAINDLRSIIKQASAMATSYPSTALQAKHGNDAKEEVSDIYANGLNAAKTMLLNNDNNEVTITKSGIICKRMDDEGMYGNKQLRITGNILALTDDGWKTVKLGVGETIFYNPFTKKYELKYGIQASVIVGELLCSENMFIGNENGSVQITGEGITISNGVIQSADYNEKEETGSIIDLRDGSFSFADGGLTYCEDNTDTESKQKKLRVKGNIEATSIHADGGYSIYSHGEKIPVLLGNRDTSQSFSPIWSVKLQIEEKSYIELRESSVVDYDKSEIDIKADTIRLLGNSYSQTSPIITSDRSLKENIKPLTDKHIKFFSLLQPVSFTFIDGTSGRTHIGFISQDVEDAMTKAGLTDLDFAGFCKKIKIVEIKDEDGNIRHEAEKDENGNFVYIYSLRYEEFIALNTFMIQRLYEKTQEMHKENQDIKKEVQILQQDNKKIKEKLGILE